MNTPGTIPFLRGEMVINMHKPWTLGVPHFETCPFGCGSHPFKRRAMASVQFASDWFGLTH
jgi:hypothetical protein